jgi:hypothetical protein
MTILYRAVSEQEKEDIDTQKVFRVGRNTLEAKQFFKTRIAVKQFVANAVVQQYDPTYAHLMIVGVDDACFDFEGRIQKLDGYDAVHIEEEDLQTFNNCVKFVRQEIL